MQKKKVNKKKKEKPTTIFKKKGDRPKLLALCINING